MERVETAGGEKTATMFAAYRSEGVQQIWEHPDREGFLDKCIGRLDRFDIPRGGPKQGRMSSSDRARALAGDDADRFGWFKLPEALAESGKAKWLFVCANFEDETVWAVLSTEKDVYFGGLPS